MTPTTITPPDSTAASLKTPRPDQVDAFSRAEVPDLRPSRSRARRMRDLSLWTRQLYVLVQTGTPLAQAMHAVERQAREGVWRQVLADLRGQIDEGLPLSEAMRRHPVHFDSITRNLIAAGEASGSLDTMLERLSRLVRWQLKIRRTITGALIYPSLLVTVALGVMVALVCIVLPRFEGLFRSLDAPLPPTTHFLIVISEVLRGQWWALLIAGALLATGVWMFLRSASGVRWVDRTAVSLPYAGALVRRFLTARFSRLLGELIQSRVQLIDALQLVRDSAGNSLYAELIEEAEESVTKGESMSAVLARSPLISPSLAEAVRHAEHNGQVGPVLVDMADFMDEENEAVVRNLTSILEPVILILLGGVVAFIALSMFLPLFDLTSMA